MKRAFLLALLLYGHTRFSAALAQSSLPAKEVFVNQVFDMVVDSNFSAYYLSEQAYPCSFVKFDYDEWVKYGLHENVSIDVLNELAKKSYYDREPRRWQPDSLLKAFCVDEGKVDSILNPVPASVREPGGGAGSVKKKQYREAERKWAAWGRLPAQERTVYYFSRPLFTDVGDYAIMDMGYRCDLRQCGMGATCLFRRDITGWKMIGRMLRWGSK
jgi:hypothetical protein